VRRVPERFAPRGAYASVGALAGQRLRAPVGAGSDVTAAALARDPSEASGPALRRGERVADVVAVAPAQPLVPGTAVDVVVTRDAQGDAPGRTTLALQDVELLAVRPSSDDRVVASLRVTIRQAVYLAAAQAFAHDIRLLPRPPGEPRRAAGATTITDRL
jgi:pilus assembly protein CpaB